MSTVTIRNKRDVEVEIPHVGWVEPGGTIDVPTELAEGRKPSGTRLDDGSFDETAPDFDAGTTGLLAHTDLWEKATKRKTTDETPPGEEG